jgi:hypothetical protein
MGNERSRRGWSQHGTGQPNLVTSGHQHPWEKAKLRLMAPFSPKKAVAVTQRRKGAKTQGLRRVGTFTGWVSEFKSQTP